MSRSSEVLKPFREKRSLLEDRIKSGIEYGRKGILFVHAQRADGSPIPGVKIKVRQKSHEFKCGANIFMIEGFESQEKNKAYEEYFARAFNLATLPFYWSTLEPEQGKPRYTRDSPYIYRRPAPDVCLEFCEKHGIEPKAHCLNYPSFAPHWARGPIDREKSLLIKRFRELSERYAGRIPSWEVTNETMWPYKSQPMNIYDSPEMIDWSFKEADRFFPGNSLVINESNFRIWNNESFFGTRSAYYMQIERALAMGRRIDTVGMQFHMFFRAENEARDTWFYYDPERHYDVLDTYEKLGRRLQITEMTIPAYRLTDEDEELQAEIVRNMFSIWFSHPAMSGVIYWNLVDGYTYVTGDDPHDMNSGENYYRGGLLRSDLTPKPAYNAIVDLFSKTWRTETQIETGADGMADFKGFYGDYSLEFMLPDGTAETRDVFFGKNCCRWFDFVF